MALVSCYNISLSYSRVKPVFFQLSFLMFPSCSGHLVHSNRVSMHLSSSYSSFYCNFHLPQTITFFFLIFQTMFSNFMTFFVFQFGLVLSCGCRKFCLCNINTDIMCQLNFLTMNLLIISTKIIWYGHEHPSSGISPFDKSIMS